MKWVKASERLPEQGDLYWTKIHLIDSPEESFPSVNNFYNGWEITDDYEVLEWLDESPKEDGEDESWDEALFMIINDGYIGIKKYEKLCEQLKSRFHITRKTPNQ